MKYHHYESKHRKRDEKSNRAIMTRQEQRHQIELREEAKSLGMSLEEYLQHVQ